MGKIQVTNCSSVGIIYRKAYPNDVFLEVKDDTHPIKAVRRGLCFLGGNWIGEAAKSDVGPCGTFVRESGEELSFDKSTRSSLELAQLGLAEHIMCDATMRSAKQPDQRDRVMLDVLGLAIAEWCVPFRGAIITVPKSVLDAADSENKRDGFKTLVSYWLVPLDEDSWNDLLCLQERFGNLSNESITLVTDTRDIVRTGRKFAFGHDFGMRTFIRDVCGDKESAEALSSVAGVMAEDLGPFHASVTYEEYLERYDVAKKPV